MTPPVQLANDENQVLMRGIFRNDEFKSGELHDAVGNIFTSIQDEDESKSGYFQKDRLCGYG